MKWYSLRVISGKEKVVKENIMFDAEEHNLDEFIAEIFVPFEKVIEMKNNKKLIESVAYNIIGKVKSTFPIVNKCKIEIQSIL